ncbi:MAG: hypothetical protein R2850_01250 [Bacteroidia bacterium]
MLSLPLWGRLGIASRLIAVQAGVSFLADIAAYYCMSTWNSNNEFIYNLYMLFEFILISGAIYYSINHITIKKIIKFLLIAFPIVVLLSYIKLEFTRLNHLALVINFILLSVFNLIYLVFPDYRDPKSVQPMLWVSIGHVVYFLGVTPYFTGREFIIENWPEMADTLFDYINNMLAVLRYLLIALGFALLYFRNEKPIRA